MTRSLGLIVSLAAVVAATSEAAASEDQFNWGMLYRNFSDSVVASVVNADANLATLALECRTNAPTPCVLPFPVTVTQGPQTIAATFDNPFIQSAVPGADAKMEFNCNMKPDQDVADCGVTFAVPGSQAASKTTEQWSMSGYKTIMRPLSVTAGAEKLSAAPSAVRAMLTAEATGSDAAATKSPSLTDADKKPSPSRSASNGTLDSSRPPKSDAEPLGAHKLVLALLTGIGFALVL